MECLSNILCKNGKLIGLWFPLDKKLSDGGPPYGTTVKEVDLTVALIGSGTSGLGTGSHLDLNGSGFNFFSQPTTGTFSNGNAFNSFKHRTGQFVVASGSQRRGWNYARVIHSVGGSDRQTNYIEWINDPNSDALASAGNGLSIFGDNSFAYFIY